jgi:hypothetical protein
MMNRRFSASDGVAAATMTATERTARMARMTRSL